MLILRSRLRACTTHVTLWAKPQSAHKVTAPLYFIGKALFCGVAALPKKCRLPREYAGYPKNKVAIVMHILLRMVKR